MLSPADIHTMISNCEWYVETHLLSYHEWNKVMQPIFNRFPPEIRRVKFSNRNKREIFSGMPLHPRTARIRMMPYNDELADHLVRAFGLDGDDIEDMLMRAAVTCEMNIIIAQLIHTCENCGIKGREMKKCERCKHVSATRYCSKNCQREAWAGHKTNCCKP